MNTLACFCRKIAHVSAAAFLLVAFFISPVQAGDGVTVSWHASPVEDEIVGYRLYYGAESRFTAGGYDYYIDFTSWEYCPANGDGVGCEPLDDTVSCENLYQDYPTCTVRDLRGHLYLAMTAYSAQEESGYTQELDYISPEVFAALQAVYQLLLH